MKNMFYKYDNKISPDSVPHKHHPLPVATATPAVSVVTNVKGDVVGVQIKQSNPFTLYFNLDDFGSVFNTTGMSLADLILSSDIIVDMYSLTGQNVLSKTYSPFEVFDEYGCYLALDFNTEDLSKLKKESYRLSVKLFFGDNSYEIFSPADSVLIVR